MGCLNPLEKIKNINIRMQKFLETNSEKFGFFFDIQRMADIISSLEKKGDDYASPILNDDEFEIFKKFKIKKRKTEWLSGRIAGKNAFTSYISSLRCTNRVSNISILNNQARAPYIVNYPELYLSISHSYEYAVAVIAPFKIGIDIEKIEPRPDSLAHYFCSQEEQALLKKDSTRKDELLTFFWSRKEAVSKFLGLGGKMNFKQISTVNDEIDISQEKIWLVSGECDEYWVSIAL